MTKVLFDHDGGIDDLLSLMLLLCSNDIELIGIAITPADCYPDDALETTLKLCWLFGRTQIPIAVGDLHGINAFPAEWRAQPKMCNALPTLIRAKQNVGQVQGEPARAMISRLLKATEEPVKVLMTGPCTNLNAALSDCPEIAHSISDVVWMAGAFNVRGNVAMHNHDGSAEWNVFWDPVSASQLLEHRFSLTLVPLDATNQFPVDKGFLTKLAERCPYQVADLAGQMWAATVTSLPSYEYRYFMWDVLATCCVLPTCNSLQFSDMPVTVVAQGPSAGRTLSGPTGRIASVLSAADKSEIEGVIINLLSRNFN